MEVKVHYQKVCVTISNSAIVIICAMVEIMTKNKHLKEWQGILVDYQETSFA